MIFSIVLLIFLSLLGLTGMALGVPGAGAPGSATLAAPESQRLVVSARP